MNLENIIANNYKMEVVMYDIAVIMLQFVKFTILPKKFVSNNKVKNKN